MPLVGVLMVLALCCLSALTPEVAERSVSTWIEIEYDRDALVITGYYEASADEAGTTLEYRLEVTKRGVSGRSTTSQSGAFTTVSGVTDTGASARIGVRPGDEVDVTLTISSGGRAVSSADRSLVVD